MATFTTFSDSYSTGQRTTCKTSNYVDFRKEVQSGFSITASELELLLPKKSKMFIDKMNNEVTCYTLENHPPYFFRREPPSFSSTLPTNQTKKNSKDEASGLLVPTLFALWRLPQLLPRATVPDVLCHKLSARVKPSSLFMAGVIVPDLPDQFVLQGAQHPRHFLQLFPNSFTSPVALDQINEIQKIADFDQSNGTSTWLSSLPGMIANQQQLYPSFFDNKAFDYLFKPRQLRAIYCESSPYCIGIGIVDDGAKELSVFEINNDTSTKPDNNYISPWGPSNNLSVAALDSIYKRNVMAPSTSGKNKNQGGNKDQNTSHNGLINDQALASAAQWPNPSPSFQITTPSAPFDLGGFLKDNKNNTNLSPSYLIYNDTTPSRKTQSLLQLGQVLFSLLTQSQALSKQPTDPMNILANICLTPSNLAQVFPDLVHYTSSNEQPESSPNGDDNNTKFNLRLIDSLHNTQCPAFGSSASHPHAADSSLLTTPAMLKDTRPLKKGSSIVMLHTMNDHLSHAYRAQFPPDSFDWVKADECAIKPLPKYLMITRCVLFLLRVSWLAACVKPYVKFNRAPVVVKGQEVALPNHLFEITDTEIPSILNKTYINQIDATQRKNALGQSGDPEGGDDDEGTLGEDEDEDDEDVEYEYVYEDEDSEELSPDQALSALTQSGQDTTGSGSNLTQKEGILGPSGICKNCYTARLEWGLQYSLKHLITEFPLQLSDVTKHIRTTSNSPNCLNHVHSKFFNDAVNSQQKSKKSNQTPDAITIHCTCPTCINISPNPTTDYTIDEIINGCVCSRRPIDLMIASANDSSYTKISQLIKIAEKLSWLNTKPIKGIQVITSVGSGVGLRSDQVDKRMVQTTITNLSSYNQAVVNSNSPLPTSSGQTFAPTLTDGANLAATVQVIHGVRYPHEFRSLLAQVESYCGQIFFNYDQINPRKENEQRSFDGLSYALKEIVSKITPRSNNSVENNALIMISLHLSLLADDNVNYSINIRNAVLEYIRNKKLTIAIRNDVIIRNELENNDNLPPIAKNILDRIKNPSLVKDVNIDHSTGVYKGPITVVAQSQSKPKPDIGDDDDDDGNHSDLDDLGNSDDDSDLDDDDFLNSGVNTKGKQISKKKNNQTKAQRKAQANEIAIKQIALTHKQNVRDQNQSSLLQNLDDGVSKSKDPVDVYLCYDKVLYQALNLVPSQNYLFTQIDSYITKRLVPLSSLSNPILYTVSQLASNNEFVMSLMEMVKLGLKGAGNVANPHSAKVTEGNQCLKQNNSSFMRIDVEKYTNMYKQFIAFKQTAVSVEKAQNLNKTNTSAHQPKILINLSQFRNKTITKVVGFELFGIAPKTIAEDSQFKKLMAASVSVVNIEALKKDPHAAARLFPASVSEKCLAMIEIQGDKCASIAKYAANTLKIDEKNIYNVMGQGKSVSYAVINKQSQKKK